MVATIESVSFEGNKALHETRLWAESLDRSVLGLFAHSDELFIAYAARLTPGLSDVVHSELLKYSAAMWWQANQRGEVEHGALNILAEVFFWRMVTSPDDEGWRDAIALDNIGDVAVMFDQLVLVHNNPAYRSYYEAGIWNDDFIAKCIADGVDPAITWDVFSASVV